MYNKVRAHLRWLHHRHFKSRYSLVKDFDDFVGVYYQWWKLLASAMSSPHCLLFCLLVYYKPKYEPRELALSQQSLYIDFEVFFLFLCFIYPFAGIVNLYIKLVSESGQFFFYCYDVVLTSIKWYFNKSNTNKSDKLRVTMSRFEGIITGDSTFYGIVYGLPRVSSPASVVIKSSQVYGVLLRHHLLFIKSFWNNWKISIQIYGLMDLHLTYCIFVELRNKNR